MLDDETRALVEALRRRAKKSEEATRMLEWRAADLIEKLDQQIHRDLMWQNEVVIPALERAYPDGSPDWVQPMLDKLREPTPYIASMLVEARAAGFKAALEMAALIAETRHAAPEWDHGYQIAARYGAAVAVAISKLKPEGGGADDGLQSP